MYEYEERKDRSSIKGVIVQILLMVMFIFILIWLFPTKSDLDKLKTPESVSSLEPLYDRIFNENIIAMKDAAKSYYTTPRLPKNVGDSVSMTLGEMLEKKIILPFTDSEGNQCDLEESYVKITKEDEEFVMKVNLKCSSQENYLLVTMGCYNYCETGICEKNEEDVTSPAINSSKPTTIVKDTVVRPIINNNITINNNNYCESENCKPGEKPTYYCKYVNGVYYGKGGNVVNEATYKAECQTSTPDPVYYCKYVNGKYYGKNGNVVSAETYKSECETPSTPVYQCKYMKTTNATYSAWSSWSDWSEKRQTSSNLKQERSQTVTQQKKENQLIGYKTVTYKDPNKPIYGNKQVLIGTRTETECAEYGYVITSTGNVSTNVTYGSWTSAGLVKLYSTPTNTSTVRYTKVSVGTETCGDCGAKLYTIYKKETRTVNKTSSGSTSENSVYKCLRNETHEVPVYGTQQVIIDYDTSTKREEVYGLVTVTREVTLYSYRTRTIIGGTTDYQISNCDDKNLLNNGYQIIDKWEA